MTSSFPGSLDSLATNLADGTTMATTHAAHHNDLADAINKIEAELGANPSLVESTVAALLANLKNANISSTAAIGVSKLAAGTEGYVLKTSAGVPTWVAASGSAGNVPFVFNAVSDYGAVAYATAALAAAGTDATTAIQNACNAANSAGGGIVYCPGGYYRISTNISLFDDVSLVGDGPTATVFVADDVTNSGVGVVKANGVITSTKSLAANAAFKDRSIQVTSSGFAAGDWLLLRDGGQFGAGVAGTNTEFMVRVLSVTAGTPDTIYLEERIPSPVGYTTANTAQALKITPMVEPAVRGVGFTVPTIGSASNRSCALDFKYTLNGVIENVRLSGYIGKSSGSGGAPPIYGFRSRNLVIRNSSFDRCSDKAGVVSPDNHNCRTVNTDSCTHVNIQGNEFTRCGGSGVMSMQQSAHIVIANNLISGHMMSFDQGDSGSVLGDQGGRGIKLLWGNVFFSVTNNIIRDIAYNGIRIDDCCFGAVNGNTFFDCFNQPILVVGTLAAAPWTSCREVSITGNTIRTVSAGFAAIALTKCSAITVVGNNIHDVAGTLSVGALDMANVTESVISSNVIDSSDYGIKVGSGVGKCTISGNRITGTAVKSIDSSTGLGTNHIWGNLVTTGAAGAVNLAAGDVKTLDTAANSNLQV